MGVECGSDYNGGVGIRRPDDNVSAERHLPYELLALFEEMQNTKEDAVFPYRILCCLHTVGMRSFAQYDIADLFYHIWNLLIEQIPYPSLVKRLRELYVIRLKEYVTCHKCSHIQSRDLEVLTIPLLVRHSKYHRNLPLVSWYWCIYAGSEDHQSFCPKCEGNTAGQKVLRLSHLPRTLSIHLNRISQQKSSQLQKVNRPLSFPSTLDLSEVLDLEQFPEQEHNQSEYQYRLFAVVAHSGTASSGHYCAYIKSWKDQKWYCFNDSSVCKVSWDDVKCTYGNVNFHYGVMACLLVYIQGAGNKGPDIGK
ncbi:hypothetical protein GDO86_005080 [Hymenochirus boettgeri]|uniref:USP domain-containing protein n=1 Tax=Hymenochirus boettgeri TaxID=247094 RepID=A0A8T2J541_9PIPI|nr:hypothetical protein GDO86_005080 [Hymenochirus boettgeri]